MYELEGRWAAQRETVELFLRPLVYTMERKGNPGVPEVVLGFYLWFGVPKEEWHTLVKRHAAARPLDDPNEVQALKRAARRQYQQSITGDRVFMFVARGPKTERAVDALAAKLAPRYSEWYSAAVQEIMDENEVGEAQATAMLNSSLPDDDMPDLVERAAAKFNATAEKEFAGADVAGRDAVTPDYLFWIIREFHPDVAKRARTAGLPRTEYY